MEEVKRAVSFAKSRGIKNIAVGIEDASRSSREYINILIKTSIEFGANQIILADTTGYSTPNEMYNLVEFAKGCINESVKLSVHCHNDLGLAVINSYFAVLAGADEIQGTIGGIGERVGNTSLEQIIGLISYKGYHDNLYCEIKKEKLYKIYLKLTQFINLEENKNLPLFGKNVFSTAAGIHQQGILNDPNTYEFVKPNDWGRNRSFYIDKHSGRSMIKQVLNKIDRNKLNEKEINNLYKKYIENLSKSITYEELEYQIKIELGERIN
nr:LeuA family protein [Staphylococcus aureus]